MRSDTQPRPEREQTDESLRLEREKADDALAEHHATVDESAHALISKARARADEVLAKARAKVDQKQSPALPVTAVVKERAQADRVVRQERATADDAVRQERVEHTTAISAERKETDEDLSQERARSDDVIATRDEFLGIVSHDLRNILLGMVGFGSLIEKAVTQEDHVAPILAHARRIQRSGARMNCLIGDLVDIASIEAGMLAVTREAVDARGIVMEAVESLQGQALARGIALETQFALPSTLAHFDGARILQVLTNLLSNAIKFTAGGGKVVVRVDRVGAELRFAVTDTGIGIAAEKLEVVFVRFVQVAENDRRGVGLGLYISKCIVNGHGGRIWAESKVGEGSTFSFTLPEPAALLRGSGGLFCEQTCGTLGLYVP